MQDFKNEIILKVDVKWYIDKIYALTKSENNLIKLYEIDINYKLIALLNEIGDIKASKQKIHLSSKPLMGYELTLN